MSNGIISVDQAVSQLEDSKVVAIPTETVYGLAGRIDSEDALNLIFSTKQRPFFDPLIVHVSSVEQAKTLVSWWPKEADLLANGFWPGPLTIVLPKNRDSVSDLITSGLDSVALRFPGHPIAQEIVKKLGVPLAAPSANMFGKTSPTSAEHVLEEFSSTVAVVDGGPADHGIESTVLELVGSEKGSVTSIQIYRPGTITKSQIESCLGPTISVNYSQSKVSPGHVENHYQPNKPLYSFLGPYTKNEIQSELSDVLEGESEIHVIELEEPSAIVARKLYSEIRKADKQAGSKKTLVMEIRKFDSSDDWAAIEDRLNRASRKLFKKS